MQDPLLLPHQPKAFNHLVNVVRLDPGIKADVEVIKHLNNLHGGAGGSDASEAHNVREEDSYLKQGDGDCEAAGLGSGVPWEVLLSHTKHKSRGPILHSSLSQGDPVVYS